MLQIPHVLANISRAIVSIKWNRKLLPNICYISNSRAKVSLKVWNKSYLQNNKEMLSEKQNLKVY